MPGSAARRAIAATVFAALAVSVTHLVISIRRAGPDVAATGRLEPLPLQPGVVVEQTMFVPGCDIDRVSLRLAGPSSGAPVRLELFDVVRDNAWPAERITTIVAPAPAAGATGSIDFDLPARLAWHSTLGMRVTSAADGTSTPPQLLVSRGSRYGGGHLRVNGANLYADDLVFAAHLAGRTTWGFLPCALSGAPPPLSVPEVWLGLLLAASIAIALLVANTVAAGPFRAGPGLAAIAFATLALAWLAILPPFEGPDERQHFEYVRHVARQGLPREVPAVRDPAQDQWVQEPLYYLLASLIVRVAGSDAPVIEANPRAVAAGGREGLLHAHRGPLEPESARRAFYSLRALGIAFGIVTLWGLWRLVRSATGTIWAAPSLAAAVALVPAFTSQMVLVSNDGLATALTTATLVLLLADRRPLTTGRALAAGLLTGLALTTKLTTSFVLPIAALAVVLDPGANGRISSARGVSGSRWRLLAWFGAGVAVATSWLLIRNVVVFGDPLAYQFKQTIMSRLGIEVNQPITLRYLAVDLTSHLYRAFWAVGWTWEHYVPRAGSRVWWIYGFTSAACVVATLVTAVSTSRWWRRSQAESPAHPHDIAGSGWLVTLSIAAVAVDLAGFYYENTRYAHITFRHLLPLQGPLLVLAAVGLRQIVGVVGKRSGTDVSRPLAAVWLVALALAMFVALRQYIVMFQFGS